MIPLILEFIKPKDSKMHSVQQGHLQEAFSNHPIMLSTIFLASTVISAPLSESVSFTADSAVLYDFGATATPWRVRVVPLFKVDT